MALLLLENDKVVGVFDDKEKFKRTTFNYILDRFMEVGKYESKKQCGVKIKEDLKLLYGDFEYTFVHEGIKYTKQIFEMNKLVDPIVVPRIEEDTKSKHKFLYYTLPELNKPLPLHDISRYLVEVN